MTFGRRSPKQIRESFEALSPREQAAVRYRSRRDAVSSSSTDPDAWRANEQRANTAFQDELVALTPDLKLIRERLSLTQEQAASLVGVKENTWARWERGEMAIHPARLRDLERLAEKATRTGVSRSLHKRALDA